MTGEADGSTATAAQSGGGTSIWTKLELAGIALLAILLPAVYPVLAWVARLEPVPAAAAVGRDATEAVVVSGLVAVLGLLSI